MREAGGESTQGDQSATLACRRFDGAGGAVQSLDEVSDEQVGVPEPEELGALGTKHGLTFNMDLGWVEELTANFGLKLDID